MSIGKKIKQIIEDSDKIAEGVINSVVKTDEIETMAAERIAICRTNTCGLYDEHGTGPNAFFPGQESCGQCGCKLSWLTRSPSSECSLSKIGKEPLWKSVTNEIKK